MNASNARINEPKAIRSLKSNDFLSISTTPILCNIKWRSSHPVTRLFLIVILTQNPLSYNSYNYHISVMIHKKFLFYTLQCFFNNLMHIKILVHTKSSAKNHFILSICQLHHCISIHHCHIKYPVGTLAISDQFAVHKFRSYVNSPFYFYRKKSFI